MLLFRLQWLFVVVESLKRELSRHFELLICLGTDRDNLLKMLVSLVFL